jgi:hypothetical protein
VLIFRVEPASKPVYVEAYAEPVRPGAARIQYFPRTDESPLLLDPTRQHDVFRKAVLVGSEHAAGRYRIHVLLREQAPDRPGTSDTAGAVFGAETLDLGVVAP